MLTTLSHLKRPGIACFNVLQKFCLTVTCRGINKEMARREAQRGSNTFRWVTPDEAVVTESLARTIVPSDEEVPGIDEVDVFGPPAIVALDALIAASAYRQNQYSRGLLGFDRWALKKHGCKFAEMPQEDQIELFRAAQEIFDGLAGGGSILAKTRNRIRAILRAGDGSYFAAKLYPLIRSDCLQVFYTNRVSWVWLQYDGPPMDKGYPKLLPRE